MSITLITLGCRLNTAESEAMRARAQEAGFGEAGFGEAGHQDVVIVNTCAVTEEAVRQARKAIRRAARENPAARIVVTGCAAQIDPESFAAMDEVSLVIGNVEKTKAEVWARLKASNSFGFAETHDEKLLITDIMAARAVAPHMAGAFREHTRAFLQVQNGCDHRCTFCVIPFGRGPSRSRAMGEVVDEVRRLIDQGVKEVVLTGVDLTSFGGDLPGAPKLGDLVRMILRHAPDLPRLRLSSIDAIELDDVLMDAIASEARLMPHLHLSLQHGDDLILKRMKRRHGREEAISLCADLRALRPDITFGADLIAGFPTEDEAAFVRSLDLIEECRLAFAHVFPYSPRPGTPAARMPQLPRELVRERAARLREAGEAARRVFLASLVGSSQSILTERGDSGHTPGFATVAFSQPVAAGQIVDACITGEDGKRLLATLTPASPERELARPSTAPMLPA